MIPWFPPIWAESPCIFLGATLGGLQTCSAHQKVLLGSHEKHKAGARLVLPQCILQPLPGVTGGEDGGLGEERLRDGPNYPERPEGQGIGADPAPPQAWEC